jgi:hypothetical protein
MDYHGITMRGDFETDNIKALSSTGIKFYDDDDNERASLSDTGIFQITTADINGGTIDGCTIATSNITVGAAKTLDVSLGTLTLADNQISGDKVEGGTIAAISITTLTPTTINAFSLGGKLTGGAYEIEGSNFDINGGNIDATAIGSSSASTGAFTTVTATTLTATNVNAFTLAGKITGGSSEIEGSNFDINGGYIDATPIGSSSTSTGAFTTITATTLTATTVNATTLDTNVAAAGVTLSGTTLSADGTDTNIDINLTPKGTGEVNITKVDIDSGNIDGTPIGYNSPSTGKFTTIEATTSLKLVGATTVTHISTDTSLTEDSDSYLATQKAIKYYIDNQSVLFENLGDGPGGYTDAYAIYTVNTGGNGIDESGVLLTPGTNTFSIVRGTAGLDIAAGASLDVNYNLTVSGASNVNQDTRTTASPTFANLTLSTGTPSIATQVGNRSYNDARYLSFKTITDGVTSIVADSYEDTLTLADSTGITVSVGETDTVTFTLATGLQQISALTQTNNYVIIGNGTSWTTADIGALTMDVSVQRGQKTVTGGTSPGYGDWTQDGVRGPYYYDITIAEAVDLDKSFLNIRMAASPGGDYVTSQSAYLTSTTNIRVWTSTYYVGGLSTGCPTVYVDWEVIEFD